MVNAQQWLNNKYSSPETKAKVEKLEIGGGKSLERFCLTLKSYSSSSSEPYINGEVAVRFWPHPRTDTVLEGNLSLKGFVNLKTIDCSFNKLTKLDLSDCPKLQELVCHDNKLISLKLPNDSWISRISCWNNQLTELVFPSNSHTPRDIFCQNNCLTKIEFGKDSNIHFINCENNQLTSLDLSINYSILSYVFCRSNKLVNLKLPSDHYIQRLDCSNNQLTSLDFLDHLVIKPPEYFSAMPCGPFTGLKIANNKFSPMDLSILSRFAYLKDLDISGNPFHGSLEPLRNMASLWWLNISDTNVDSGLEYLPWTDSSFDQLRLVAELKNENSRVRKIQEELKLFGGSLQKWKENWDKKSLGEKLEILGKKTVEQSKELHVFRILSENWRTKYQDLQEENDKLKNQLSEMKKTVSGTKKIVEENKAKSEKKIEELQKKLEVSEQKSLIRIQDKETKINDLEKVNAQLSKELKLANEEKISVENNLDLLLEQNPWLIEKDKFKKELDKIETKIKELKNQKQELEDYLLNQANYISFSETEGVFELWSEFIKTTENLVKLQKQSAQYKKAKELFDKKRKLLLTAKQLKGKVNDVYRKCEKLMEIDLQLQHSLSKKGELQEKNKEMLSNSLEKQTQQLQTYIQQIS